VAPRQPLPDQELLDYSAEHVAYEVQMLRGTKALLAAIATGALDVSLVMKNALIESWMVHLRDLVEFLYPAVPKQGDVIATDFFDSRAEWERIRPSQSESLKKARKRANKELAHLTTGRKGPGDREKGWAFHDLTSELVDVLRTFGEKASEAKLHQKVRDALAISPALTSQ